MLHNRSVQYSSVVHFFTDTFKLYQIVNGAKKPVPFDGKGIAWWSDYNVKYRNPSVTPLKNAFNGNNFGLIHHVDGTLFFSRSSKMILEE